jgi:hypothetical protein
MFCRAARCETTTIAPTSVRVRLRGCQTIVVTVTLYGLGSFNKSGFEFPFVDLPIVR